MKKMIKTLCLVTVISVALFLGQNQVNADETYTEPGIDIINGLKEGAILEGGVITTSINSCTHTTDSDDVASGVITIGEKSKRYITVDSGCTQTLKITVKEGYEIESILMDRQYVQPTSDNTYTFDNITAPRSFCVTYKKAGTPNSPNTGDSAYVLPLVGATIVSFGAILLVMKKRRNVKA